MIQKATKVQNKSTSKVYLQVNQVLADGDIAWQAFLSSDATPAGACGFVKGVKQVHFLLLRHVFRVRY